MPDPKLSNLVRESLAAFREIEESCTHQRGCRRASSGVDLTIRAALELDRPWPRPGRWCVADVNPETGRMMSPHVAPPTPAIYALINDPDYMMFDRALRGSPPVVYTTWEDYLGKSPADVVRADWNEIWGL